MAAHCSAWSDRAPQQLCPPVAVLYFLSLDLCSGRRPQPGPSDSMPRNHTAIKAGVMWHPAATTTCRANAYNHSKFSDCISHQYAAVIACWVPLLTVGRYDGLPENVLKARSVTRASETNTGLEWFPVEGGEKQLQRCVDLI